MEAKKKVVNVKIFSWSPGMSLLTRTSQVFGMDDERQLSLQGEKASTEEPYKPSCK